MGRWMRRRVATMLASACDIISGMGVMLAMNWGMRAARIREWVRIQDRTIRDRRL